MTRSHQMAVICITFISPPFDGAMRSLAGVRIEPELVNTCVHAGAAMTPTEPGYGIREAKQAIREQIWARLMAEHVAAFPFPIVGRIPNYQGAEQAAARLAEIPEYQRARVVKVNPDSPQRPVRRRVLEDGKRLLMPTPRLRGGFTMIDPAGLKPAALDHAATITGAFQVGRTISLAEVPSIELIVAGTVAVAPNGARVGKGEGFSELEYGTLRELGIVDESVPIATTVHDLQLVTMVPLEPFDVPMDIVVTPTRVIRTEGRPARPTGILWQYLDSGRLEAMPILAELYASMPPP